MNNARREIQQMRADVDALAAKPATPEKVVFNLVRQGEEPMKVHMRRLHLGEPRQKGDLWLDPASHRLVPLVLPWLHRYGVLTFKHADHFRILP